MKIYGIETESEDYNYYDEKDIILLKYFSTKEKAEKYLEDRKYYFENKNNTNIKEIEIDEEISVEEKQYELNKQKEEQDKKENETDLINFNELKKQYNDAIQNPMKYNAETITLIENELIRLHNKHR